MAENYLVHPTAQIALARSRAQAIALKCDGINTQYWWRVQPLTDGTAAIVIESTGPFGTGVTINGFTGTLTGQETAALLSKATITPLLPPPFPLTPNPTLRDEPVNIPSM